MIIPRDGSVDAQELRAITALRAFFTPLASGFTSIGTGINNAVRWLCQAPSALFYAIEHGIQWLVSVALYAGKIIVFVLIGFMVLVAAIALLHFAFDACRIHIHKRYIQRREHQKLRRSQEEAASQLEQTRTRRQRWQQEHEAARRRVAEQEQALERAQVQTRERLRRQEQARQALELERDRIQTEQRRLLREAAHRAQQGLEDRRLYARWRAACDDVFSCGTGKLPDPPLKPCAQAPCQLPKPSYACSHSIERLFGATGRLHQTLQDERGRWLPDRPVFEWLSDTERSVTLATEISQAIQILMGPDTLDEATHGEPPPPYAP